MLFRSTGYAEGRAEQLSLGDTLTWRDAEHGFDALERELDVNVVEMHAKARDHTAKVGGKARRVGQNSAKRRADELGRQSGV